MTNASDAQLMDRYARGDARAFDELFDRWDRRMFGFFMRRARCPERSADLHQELFLRLHRFRDYFDPSKAFQPWVFSLARNVWHDDLRRRHLPDATGSETLEAADASFESRVNAAHDAEQLLESLPAAHRDLLLATTVGGFTYAELAPRMGRSVGALKQIGSRALRRLRKFEEGDS